MTPREYLKADRKKLRSFGLIMFVPLALIGGYLLWKGASTGPYWLGAAVLFALLGLALPKALKPVYVVWMTFAYILSQVMTYVLLTIFFFLVVTPGGIIMRLIRKDMLDRKFPGDGDSYWVDAERYANEIERYSKPY